MLGYTDLDLVGDLDEQKLMFGYVITFTGDAVAWQSRFYKCMELSTTKDEFIVKMEGYK